MDYCLREPDFFDPVELSRGASGDSTTLLVTLAALSCDLTRVCCVSAAFCCDSVSLCCDKMTICSSCSLDDESAVNIRFFLFSETFFFVFFRGGDDVTGSESSDEWLPLPFLRLNLLKKIKILIRNYYLFFCKSVVFNFTKGPPGSLRVCVLVRKPFNLTREFHRNSQFWHQLKHTNNSGCIQIMSAVSIDETKYSRDPNARQTQILNGRKL